MPDSLNSHEARVLGVLIEKAFTTPDQYPLTLNALTNGCNQKSNRSPKVDYGEAEVSVALDGLRFKHIAGALTGGRAERWRHTALEHFDISERALAVLGELLLRGAQPQGELRTRASRMQPIGSLEELAETLRELQQAGFVQRIGPAPGSRAERWQQLLSEEDGQAAAATEKPRPSPSTRAPRIPDLEARVTHLEQQLALLAKQLGVDLGATSSPPQEEN
ncbi:MAG: hypothetical protein CMJ86_07455 [Planctomycetes bacterium]|jgi:hypothetical protein|nr:hypothetical protein [Planctomycetota bacterium]